MTRSPQEPTARAERAVEALPWEHPYEGHTDWPEVCIHCGLIGSYAHTQEFYEKYVFLSRALVPAAATERLDARLLQKAFYIVTDNEPYDLALVREGVRLWTDFMAEYARLARSEGGEDPTPMSLLDRDTYNRLAGSAEPDGGGGA